LADFFGAAFFFADVPRFLDPAFTLFLEDLADAARLPRDLDALRFALRDFPRDFLARVAMMLLLGIDGKRRHKTIAATGDSGKCRKFS
jgi:hypothetical protein